MIHESIKRIGEHEIKWVALKKTKQTGKLYFRNIVIIVIRNPVS